MMNKRRHGRIKRILATAQRVLTICAGLIIVSGAVYFGWLFWENWHIDRANRQIQNEFYQADLTAQQQNSAAVSTIEPVLERVQEELPREIKAETVKTLFPSLSLEVVARAEEVTPVLQPQFQTLFAENNDVIGWLKMGGEVDLPVVWRDNSYYLDHDFYGDDSKAGAIFLDGRNQADLSDDELLIYGHNMKNGSMFGNLDKFRKLSYLCQHPIISLQYAWEEEPRKYVLISLFDASLNATDPSYIKITHFNFDDEQSKQEFIDDMCARSMFEIPLSANVSDQIVIMVTCSYTHDNGRFLLMARLLHDDETEEAITDIFAAMQ